MLMPMMIGYTPEKFRAPVTARDCSMATVAEEDCTITVSTRPAKIPRTGLSPRPASRSIKAGLSAKPFTAPVIFIKPTNRIPKPMQISPASLLFLLLTNIIRIIPAKRATGAKVSVSKSHNSQFWPSLSTKAKVVIQAVIVVPILAPITMETACRKVRTPAPIRATARTMVAVEL